MSVFALGPIMFKLNARIIKLDRNTLLVFTRKNVIKYVYLWLIDFLK